MQAVHVWLFSCFSTQVSLICPFFIYFSVLFSKKVKFSLPQKTYFQNYIRDIRKVLLKRCSMYVGVGRERINSIQEKRGWTHWITMTWQPFDFLHFSVNIVHFKKCVLFSNHAISRLYITRNLESIVSLTRVIISSFTLYFYVSFCLLFAYKRV